MFKYTILPLILIFGLQGTSQSATTVGISLAELDTFINEAPVSGDDLSRLIAGEIQAALDLQGFQLNENGLLIPGTIPGIQIRGGCSAKTKFNGGTYNITVNPQSRMDLILDSLKKPITVSADLYGNVQANGSVTIRFGIRTPFGCAKYAKDNIKVSMSADIDIGISLQVNLNPTLIEDELDGSMTIKINPTVILSGKVRKFANKKIDIADFDSARFIGIVGGGFFGLVLSDYLIKALEGYLEDRYTVGELDSRFQEALVEQSRSVRVKLAQALLSDADFIGWKQSFDIVGSNPPIIVSYRIPGLTTDILEKLKYFIGKLPEGLPITLAFLRENQREIIYYLLVGDNDALMALLGSSLACEASNILLTDMRTTPLYHTPVAGMCSVADLAATNITAYFSDSACTNSVNYKPSSYVEYCQDVMTQNKSRLGNAALFDGIAQSWSLSPGTQFDLGALSIKRNNQPFMFKENYKTSVDPDKGQCKLEMRVYKKDINATNLRPMIAIHGGGWKYRGAAFVGMESQISHYTQKRFAVFVPFYRLAGSADGNAECNQFQWQDITEDADAALTWVQNNMDRYGASGLVSLMGQSGGGHLAAWLATKRSAEIQNALLFYPPVDFKYAIEQFRVGNQKYINGEDALTGFLGESIETIALDSPAVIENSFPDIVAANPSLYPPMFLVHGKRDSLVPSEMSVRMCNALSGFVDSGPAIDDGGDPLSGVNKKVYYCDDRGSQLHLTAEGEHAMDICIANLKCFSGNDAGILETADTIKAARNWLYDGNTAGSAAVINIITTSFVLD